MNRGHTARSYRYDSAVQILGGVSAVILNSVLRNQQYHTYTFVHHEVLRTPYTKAAVHLFRTRVDYRNWSTYRLDIDAQQCYTYK